VRFPQPVDGGTATPLAMLMPLLLHVGFGVALWASWRAGAALGAPGLAATGAVLVAIGVVALRVLEGALARDLVRCRERLVEG
jgi:hypothetical protein